MDNKQIGKCIKIARKRTGLSRYEVANYFKIPARELFKYEVGKKEIPIETLTRLLHAGIWFYDAAD